MYMIAISLLEAFATHVASKESDFEKYFRAEFWLKTFWSFKKMYTCTSKASYTHPEDLAPEETSSTGIARYVTVSCIHDILQFWDEIFMHFTLRHGSLRWTLSTICCTLSKIWNLSSFRTTIFEKSTKYSEALLILSKLFESWACAVWSWDNGSRGYRQLSSRQGLM